MPHLSRFLAGAFAVIMFAGCANTPAAREKKDEKARKTLVGGTWARHLDELVFSADGTYEAHNRAVESPTHGTWKVRNQVLFLTENSNTAKHQIVRITDHELELTFSDGTEGLHYDR